MYIQNEKRKGKCMKKDFRLCDSLGFDRCPNDSVARVYCALSNSKGLDCYIEVVFVKDGAFHAAYGIVACDRVKDVKEVAAVKEKLGNYITELGGTVLDITHVFYKGHEFKKRRMNQAFPSIYEGINETAYVNLTQFCS